ncbi:hypothetical protein K491DRAFT_684885 [Lophiostoma macrostomum CBS 122681]|uniref:Uncharacterized protein n=1 Tax=Lophiostoma macrostomum CBS 122681 TaxID=1314788 RepID=A0A6A6SPA9_9PLEO|nr:hypothetical protein K491DRAFT_684885 [Lophiostoma macrostomum CBS 122681]
MGQHETRIRDDGKHCTNKGPIYWYCEDGKRCTFDKDVKGHFVCPSKRTARDNITSGPTGKKCTKDGALWYCPDGDQGKICYFDDVMGYQCGDTLALYGTQCVHVPQHGLWHCRDGRTCNFDEAQGYYKCSGTRLAVRGIHMDKGTAIYTSVMAGGIGLFVVAVALLGFGLWRIEKRRRTISNDI